MSDARHPVDSAIRSCCRGIGGHTQDCTPYTRSFVRRTPRTQGGIVAALVGHPAPIFTPEPRADRIARRVQANATAGRIITDAAMCALAEPATTPPTLFEVVVTCDQGCGRTVTHHGIDAPSEQTAWWIALERMQGDGWRWEDGAVVCRACLLRASGWQSQPGPAEPGHEMSVDHSRPGCCQAGGARESSPAQTGAGREAAPVTKPQK